MKAPKRVVVYLGLLLITIAIVVGGRSYMDSQGGPGTTVIPKVGGPFTLVDHSGKTVTDADFHGKFVLIFFGYTFCPDVCPTALNLMAEAMDILGKDAEKVTPLFITIDPERDSPEDLKEYVSHFYPRLVGLTGSREQVNAVTKVYKVYSAKIQMEGSDKDDYAMDHSSIIYFNGPDGKYRALFGEGTTPKSLAEGMRKFL